MVKKELKEVNQKFSQKDLRIMVDKTKRSLAEQCTLKQEIIDKKRQVADFEKTKLQRQEVTYENKLVVAN